jgi:hypothetical protein
MVEVFIEVLHDENVKCTLHQPIENKFALQDPTMLLRLDICFPPVKSLNEKQQFSHLNRAT